jgi:serine/threonine protein kinase
MSGDPISERTIWAASRKVDQSNASKAASLPAIGSRMRSEAISSIKSAGPTDVPQGKEETKPETASLPSLGSVLRSGGNTFLEKTRLAIVGKFLREAFAIASEKLEQLPSPFEPKEIKSIGKHTFDIATDQLSHEDKAKVDPKLEKAIRKIIAVQAKQLKKNQSVEVALPNLKDKHIVVMKGTKGKIEVFVKEKLLGKGGFGEVYKAVSATKERMQVALKYTKQFEADNVEESQQEIEEGINALRNESEILNILNKDKPQEGIQESITISSIKGSQDSQKISKGKLYANGDFQKQFKTLRFAQLMGVKGNELDKLDEEKIKSRIEGKLQAFYDRSAMYEEMKKVLLEQKDNLPSTDIEGRRNCLHGVSNYNALITNEMGRLVREVSSLVNEYDENTAQAINQKLSALQHWVRTNEDKPVKEAEIEFNGEKVKFSDLFEPVKEVAKKYKEVPVVDLQSRMKMAGQLVSGLRYIHKKKIVHGDIKPQNFFWDKKATKAVIADFGGSQFSETQMNSNYASLPHTLDYGPKSYLTAMFKYHKNRDEENWLAVGQAFDLREMGISLYEMLAGGEKPEDGSTEFYDPKTYEDMKNHLIDIGVPPEAAEIIRKMAQPIYSDKNPVPVSFQLPVTDQEMETLGELLKS